MEVQLISVEKIKRLGYVHANVGAALVEVTLRRAQSVALEPVLGAERYKEITDAVAASMAVIPTPLSAIQTELLNDYIQPYLVAVVDLRICTPLLVRLRDKSPGNSTDENHQAASYTELVRLQDQFREDVSNYEARLARFLALNASSFACGTCEPLRIHSPVIRFV
jgi:hypothetical protein